MTKEEILYCLEQIVTPYVQNDEAFEDFNEKTDLFSHLEIDPSHLVDILLDVEKEFEIGIENSAMGKLVKVQDAVKLIEEKRARA